MTRNLFKRFAREEERMLRATMPRVSATDAIGLREPVARPFPRPVARPLTFTLSEVTQ